MRSLSAIPRQRYQQEDEWPGGRTLVSVVGALYKKPVDDSVIGKSKALTGAPVPEGVVGQCEMWKDNPPVRRIFFVTGALRLICVSACGQNRSTVSASTATFSPLPLYPFWLFWTSTNRFILSRGDISEVRRPA